MKNKRTNSKIITGCLIFLIISAVMPGAESQSQTLFHRGEPIPPRLFFDISVVESTIYSLVFVEPTRRTSQYDKYGIDFYYFYSLNIEFEICIDPANFDFEGVNLELQLRCDGDNDGEFEYVVDFSTIHIMNRYIHETYPSSVEGSAIDMNGGTIELVISRTDSNPGHFTIDCSSYSFVQVPYDVDSDEDGLTDYSDPDDDNDGHSDAEDIFPDDPTEWKDSDFDHIGDNADDDDNGNNIPDDYEIFLIAGIICIPIVLFVIVNKRIKNKGDDKEEKAQTIVYHMKFKKIPRKYRKRKKYL
jgi:hypothetical protein